MAEAHSPNEPQKCSPSLKTTNADRIAFHMAEFNALKGEIAALIKQMWIQLTFALSASGGIAAWLLTTPLGPDVIDLARWLPFAVSGSIGLLAGSSYLRAADKRRYIRKLEQALGDRCLGWEGERAHNPMLLALAHTASWGAVNGIGIIFALFGPETSPLPALMT